MTCRDVAEFLDNYLDGTLPWRQRLIFRLHLRLCRDCRRYLKSYRLTVNALQSLTDTSTTATREWPPQVVPDELVQAVLAAQRQYAAELGRSPETQA